MTDLQGWLRGFQRAKTPNPQVGSSYSSSLDDGAAESTANMVIGHGRPLSSKMSPSMLDFSHTSSPSKIENLHHRSERLYNGSSVWHEPTSQQMVETLKVVMMTRQFHEPVPVEYNACISHVLEGYQELEIKLKAMEEDRDEKKLKYEAAMNQRMSELIEWEERENAFKDEVKRLEVLLASDKRGLELVTLARSNSTLCGNPSEQSFPFSERLRDAAAALELESTGFVPEVEQTRVKIDPEYWARKDAAVSAPFIAVNWARAQQKTDGSFSNQLPAYLLRAHRAGEMQYEDTPPERRLPRRARMRQNEQAKQRSRMDNVQTAENNEQPDQLPPPIPSSKIEDREYEKQKPSNLSINEEAAFYQNMALHEARGNMATESKEDRRLSFVPGEDNIGHSWIKSTSADDDDDEVNSPMNSNIHAMVPREEVTEANKKGKMFPNLQDARAMKHKTHTALNMSQEDMISDLQSLNIISRDNSQSSVATARRRSSARSNRSRQSETLMSPTAPETSSAIIAAARALAANDKKIVTKRKKGLVTVDGYAGGSEASDSGAGTPFSTTAPGY